MRQAPAAILALLLATAAHAERIAIYLPETDAIQLHETLSRDDLTRTERLTAGKFLPWGLQSWPGMEERQPKCKRTFFYDGRIWYRIVIDPPAIDTAAVSVARLTSLLHSIANHTDDGWKVLQIEWLALVIAQCGESVP